MGGWMDGCEWMYTDCDQVQLARLIGQLHYSAMTAGCEDSAAELRDMHVRMLMSGDELQQVNGIRSLPDFARHDSAAVAAHIERCCGELVRLLHPSTGAGGMEDSTRLHLLDAFVFVVPAFVRRLDEDVLQNEVGISGGAPLTHQVQHPKTLQGLNHSRVSACFVDAVCKLLELATETRQQRWVAEGSKPSTVDAGVLPPIPGAPDREDFLSSGLWSSSPTTEAKAKRSLEEKYVDAALAVVRMSHGDQRGPKTAEQEGRIERAMGPWRVMIASPFIHRALCSGLAALGRQLTVETSPGRWAPAPAAAQDVLKRVLEECSQKPAGLAAGDKRRICEWSWSRQMEGGPQAIRLHCQLPMILTAISPQWEGRIFWLQAMQAAYNGYLAERRVELADGTWRISEDGLQVEIAGAAKAFPCSVAIVDPLSLAYQLPAALRLFQEVGELWAEALVRLCMHTCMHAYKHTYAYIHTYIQIHAHPTEWNP